MDNLYDKIEQYLSGELKGAELATFEKQMQEDKSLAKEVELVKKIRFSLSDQFQQEEKEMALKETLAKTGSKYFAQESEPRLKIRSIWLNVIATAAIIALALIIWQPWLPTAPFDQYYKAPIAQLGDRGNETVVNLASVETAFNQGNYATALPLIDQYLQQHPTDLEVMLLKGVCQLELEQYEEAITTFKSIHLGISAYKNEGTWYLALSYLKQNKTGECVQYLQQIPNGADRYSAAQKLLVELE